MPTTKKRVSATERRANAVVASSRAQDAAGIEAAAAAIYEALLPLTGLQREAALRKVRERGVMPDARRTLIDAASVRQDEREKIGRFLRAEVEAFQNTGGGQARGDAEAYAMAADAIDRGAHEGGR